MADQAQKDRFVQALTELGGSAGHGRLRQTLQWDEATYNAVKEDLLAAGIVTPGRGRGGSVSLSNLAEAEALEAAPAVARVKPARGNGNGGNLGFEAELFKAADKLRGNMEPSDYKHVALGLIFLKHISDSFEAKRADLLADYPDGAEDPDEYAAENVFWVPKEARWSHLQANAKQSSIGKLIDVWLIDPDRRGHAVCSTEFLAFDTSQSNCREFLYETFVDPAFRQRLEAIVTGTSRSHQRISPQAVLDLLIGQAI